MSYLKCPNFPWVRSQQISRGQLSFLTTQTSKSSDANWKAIGVPKHGDARICNKGKLCQNTQICYLRTLFSPNKCQNILCWLKGSGCSGCRGLAEWKEEDSGFMPWWGQNMERRRYHTCGTFEQGTKPPNAHIGPYKEQWCSLHPPMCSWIRPLLSPHDPESDITAKREKKKESFQINVIT